MEIFYKILSFSRAFFFCARKRSFRRPWKVFLFMGKEKGSLHWQQPNQPQSHPFPKTLDAYEVCVD